MSLKTKLNTHTKLSTTKRKKVIKWLVNQNEEIVLIAFEKQKEYFFQLSKQDEPNKSVLYLSALYMAVDHLYGTYYSQNSKRREMDLHSLQGATRLQAKKLKRTAQSMKYDKLLNLKNKILVLKNEENLSFRQISKFLLTYHKLEVSHSYIATFYHTIKEKND